MKKKILSTILTAALCVNITPSALAKDISVTLNDKSIEFDQPPIIDNGRTLVPLRAIFEALGAEVTWEDSVKTATATKDNYSVSITINANNMYKEDSAIPLDVPAKIVNGRTLVPARAIAESFGCDVNWDAENKTVEILTPEEEPEIPAFEKLKNFLVENGKYDADKGYSLTNKKVFEETSLDITYNPTTDLLFQTLKYYDLSIGLAFPNDNSTEFDYKKVYGFIILRDSEPYLVAADKSKFSVSSNSTKDLDEKMAEFYDDYTINGASAKTDFAPIVEGIMAHSHRFLESKGLDLHPDDLLYIDTTPTEPQTTTMYTPSGASKKIYVSQKNAYSNNGWYNAPVVTMYALDGRTTVAPKAAVNDWKNEGWYEFPVITMYSLDGKTKVAAKKDVDAYKEVGIWYEYPVAIMYALDGRTQVVPKSEIEANKKVGWYETKAEVTQTLYSTSNTTMITKTVYKSEVPSYLKVGWRTYKPNVRYEYETCSKCRGKGSYNCDLCNGSGDFLDHDCHGCNGTGRENCIWCDGTGQERQSIYYY